MKKRIFIFILCISILCLMGCGAKPEETPTTDGAPSGEKDLFVEFLGGNATATADSDCGLGSVLTDAPGAFTVTQITNLIREKYTGDPSGIGVHFALTTSTSGQSFLLLRYSGLAVSDADDGSYALLFFCEENGGLVLTYALRNDPANEVMLRHKLVITGTSTQGSASITQWCGFIEENGRFHMLYQLQRFQGRQIPKYIGDEAISALDWTNDDVFEILNASGDTSFDFRCSGPGGDQKQEQMIQYLEESGLDYANNLDELMFSAIADYGVAEWPEFDNWTPLPG